MDPFITWLEPQPSATALPERFPSPFDDVAPHPLARHAALELQAQLRSGFIAPGVSTASVARPEGGKMFGVLLVAAPDGRVGVLKAYSGQLAGTWTLPGYVPPVFDAALRLAVEPGAETLVKALTARLEAWSESPEFRAARAQRRALAERHGAERVELKRVHLARREARHEARREAPALAVSDLRRLDAESRQDDTQRRAQEARWREESRRVADVLRPLERRLGALERLRRVISQESMRRIHDSYLLTNLRGASTSLRALFAPAEPPWGAADCAAPKLVAYALRAHLRPVALAEFWWGPPPSGGGRVEGMFFPACRPKCGPLLPFLLDGVDVEARRTWRPMPLAVEALTVQHQDERVLVVLKPAGLLSVPARDELVTDSVWARLRQRFPGARGPLLVHRLDLDTSGLLLVALDEEAHRYLQAQFLSRDVKKRYAAWLDGDLLGTCGTVSLPLRVDLDQRPRQLVDWVHGREAVTEWEVTARSAGRTRVALMPRTGRTHQLRVHAAHPKGLGLPIVGDRLYGRPGERLLLHAESLAFNHPDGRRLTVTAPAPF